MAKRQALSSSARRALVISYVNQGLVHSQQDLVELLSDEGIEVTQATASRDLEEIGAVRGKDGSGELRYRLLDQVSEQRSRINRVSDELMLSITASGNLVVIKTPAGGAQLLASTLDRASQSGQLTSLIGTIAGDDTVLAISRSASGGKALSAQLRDFIASSTRRSL
ncbi:MAG: arginine repressor, partial [Actinobacteria bacterium]|nr:arginine repressor [Actinomycetota bacterium]